METLIPFYYLLQKYYSGELNHLTGDQWVELIQALRGEPAATGNIAEGLDMISKAGAQQMKALEYEFNRLFVGPGKLEAPPYASCCLGGERALMQARTMEARSYYRKAGLELVDKNVEPDDFIGFELEFILFLLTKEPPQQELCRDFLEHHLLLWYGCHLSDIRSHTGHPICLGMAAVLEEVIIRSAGGAASSQQEA